MNSIKLNQNLSAKPRKSMICSAFTGHSVRSPLKPEAHFSLKSKKNWNEKIHSFQSVDRRKSVGLVVSGMAYRKVRHRFVMWYC